MISSKIKEMMRKVDTHISKKERLKAMSLIEDIVVEFNKLKTEQTNKAKQEKQIWVWYLWMLNNCEEKQ